MNERTNPRDITSQASSSAAAPQEHGAHGIKPVAAPMVPAGAQPSVVVKARATNTLRPSDELLDALSDESTLINDTEAADPAPIPAVDPAPVVAEVAGAAATTTAPAALDAAGAGAATTGAAAASTAAETTAATAGATAAGTATATGSFFSTTAGIATMAGGGVVVLGAAAGGGSKAAPAPTPAPVVAPTAPTVALATDSGSNPTDKITNNGALSLSNLATGATVEYRLDTGSWTSVTATNGSATVPTPTTDGAHTIEVRQTTSGGQSPISTITFTLDTQAPAGVTPVLANGATTLTNSAALAAITPAAGATVEYRVDGGTWGAYTAPSAQGAHTVEARQVDVAGNASAISTASFTLDTVAPAAPVVALANNATTLTNSAVLTTVTPEAGATVEYRVDGSNWATTYTAPTGNTAHTVDVRQTDAAGNISASTTLSFTLDTVAPASVTPTLANGATTLTNNAALTALPATEVGATVEYRVDGGAWGAYTAPAAQGAHTVEARQVDAAGNASAASAPLAFTLDTQAPVAPTLALVNGAAAGTTTNNGSVSVSGVEVGATVEYQVNASGTWLPLVADAQGAYNVPSPTVPGLSYTVDVRQTDAAGNVSTSFGSINFTLSSAGSAPTVGLVNDTGASGTDLITSIAQLKITPAANTAPNSTVIEYSTDGGRTWGPSFTPTANAVNVVEVRYNNPADTTGNSATLPASFTFTLDTQVVAPTLSLQTGTSALTNSSAVTLGGIEAGALVEYSTDGATWAAQQPAAVQGGNTLYVRQTDVAGNVSAASAALTFNLDSIAPTAPVVALANGATTLTNNAGLKVTSEPGATVEYSVDNGAWSSAYSAPVGDIAHTVKVRQTDAAGNVSATTSIAFTLDTVAPIAPVVALANGATSLTNNATLAAITPEAGATVEYSVNGSAWSTTYTAPTTATNGTAYTVNVRQTDTAGNVSASTALAFTLDNVAPTAPVVALANGATTLTNNATLAAVAATEAGATVQYSVDGSTTWGAYTAPTIDGAHTVGVREVDAAGNISTSTTLTFTLDTLAPAAPSLVLSGTQNAVSATAPVTNSAIDLVGVEAGATVQYRVYTGATPSAWTSLVAVGGVYTVPSQPTSGLYTVDVQVTDAAGNTSSLSSASFNLQGTPGPVAQLVSDTGIAGDLITSNGALNVPASTTAGLTQVQYSADGTTGWTATAPTWVEGLNTTHLRYVDPNGATPVSLVTTFQFTLDTVAPNVSTSSLTYTPSTLPATQGTLVATVALGANAAVGDTLTLTIANASTQPVARALSAADIAAGSVSITIDQATLVSGTTTSASAHITDVAGNSLPAVVSTALTFDNVAATPTNLALAVDSGVVGDNITNNATLAALVGVETGATVQYSVDGGISWSGTYTPPTVDGQHSVEVRQIDAAGNLSAASTPLVYTLDATTPNVTSVGLSYVASALAATAGTVTATVALGANAAAGDTLTLTVTGASASPVPVVLTTANIQSGTVSFTIDQATLTSGSSYTANAHITDVAGNTSTTVTSAALAFDNVVVAPTGLALATDSGTPGDFLTNNAALAALVGVETGATVEYSLDNGAWGAYTAPTIGDGTLASQHTVAVRQIDAAGNISVASAPLTFTLDTIVATPTISLVTDTGVVGDSITSVATLNAPTGIEAGATVQYSVDGGAWGAAYTVPALDGPHTVSVRQTDVAGNVSTPSTPLAFTLDTVALAPGVKLLADTGVSATDGLTNNAALAPLTGVEPGALVEYNLDNGGWLSSYTPPTANGLHSVIVRQTDVAGNVSLASAPLAFTLDTVAPVALVSGVTGTPGVTLGLLNDTVDPSAFALPGLNVDRITKDPTPAVTPETAGNLVEFSADGLNWFATVQQITHPGGVAVDGAYSLTVRETDAAGNTTTSAPGAYSFTLDTVATAPTLTLDPLTSTTVGGVTYSRNGSFWDAATAALLPSSYTDIHHSTELYSLDAGLSWVDLATTQLNLSTRAAGTGRPTTVWVQQTDAAGNVSPTGTLSFILDNATLAPFVGMASDTGVLNDLTTNNPTFALVATEANSTYFYSFDNVSWTPVTLTPGTSNFGVTLPAVDAAGAAVPAQIASATPFNIWVQQMDIAGNTASFLAAFNVDNFAGAPVVTATNTALTQVASGIAVSDGRLNLGGEVGATFAVSADNGATWVDSSIYTPTTMGANNLLIHQIDAAGNVSANTAFNLNLQGIATTNAATAPAPGPDTASLFTALPHLTLTDTGVSAIDHITNNAGISLTAAQPTLVGDTLSYSVDGGLTWTNNALTPFAPTANAVNTLLIKESYMAGTTMHETPVLPVSFTLDTAAPTSAPTPMYNAAELFTSASGAPSVAVVRVTYNEAVSVNALTATFLGQNTAAGQYTSKVVSSGLSMDSGVSLGVQLDGTTVVELRFTENAGSVGAFTTAQIVPTISLMATDLAGNSAQVPFTVSMTPNLPSFADWTAATLP